ncbi:MAG: ATP:cob(I)alamin adenosyltransferase, partial [Duncaniella sp.]|nr:ATP:cob(I)alamin adenosyltransferase [Duncaniella sp.]
LEQAIDRLDASVPPQKTFILPGGTVAASVAHVARTVCRRAEREVLTLADAGAYVHPMVTRYINRLSDYLFILARSLNHLAGVSDIPWP